MEIASAIIGSGIAHSNCCLGSPTNITPFAHFWGPHYTYGVYTYAACNVSLTLYVFRYSEPWALQGGSQTVKLKHDDCEDGVTEPSEDGVSCVCTSGW